MEIFEINRLFGPSAGKTKICLVTNLLSESCCKHLTVQACDETTNQWYTWVDTCSFANFNIREELPATIVSFFTPPSGQTETVYIQKTILFRLESEGIHSKSIRFYYDGALNNFFNQLEPDNKINWQTSSSLLAIQLELIQAKALDICFKFIQPNNFLLLDLIKKFLNEYATPDENLNVVHIALLESFEDTDSLINLLLLVDPNAKWANQQSKNRQTPLLMATRTANKKIFTLLLEKCNADPTIADADGYNVVHWLCKTAQPDLLDLVIQFVADDVLQKCLEAKDKTSGNTPLHFAVHLKNFDLFKKLVAVQKKMNGGDLLGCTVLHWICFYELKPFGELLFQQPNLDFLFTKCNLGYTALQVATQKNSQELTELLQSMYVKFCFFCGKKIEMLLDMKQHMEYCELVNRPKIESPQVKKLPPPLKTKSIPCLLCKRKFATRLHYDRHLKMKHA